MYGDVDPRAVQQLKRCLGPPSASPTCSPTTPTASASCIGSPRWASRCGPGRLTLTRRQPSVRHSVTAAVGRSAIGLREGHAPASMTGRSYASKRGSAVTTVRPSARAWAIRRRRAATSRSTRCRAADGHARPRAAVTAERLGPEARHLSVNGLEPSLEAVVTYGIAPLRRRAPVTGGRRRRRELRLEHDEKQRERTQALPFHLCPVQSAVETRARSCRRWTSGTVRLRSRGIPRIRWRAARRRRRRRRRA